MPRYYLHLDECGIGSRDDEGRDAVDVAAARAAAIKEARVIMAAEVQEGRLCLACCIIITDHAGAEIDRVRFRDALTVNGLREGG